MSDTIGDLEDAVETVAAKKGRGIVHALSNGTGLVAVRLCFFLMTGLFLAGGIIWNLTLAAVRSEIHGVSDKVDSVATDVKSIAKADKKNTDDIVQLKIEFTQLEGQENVTNQRVTDKLSLTPLRP